MRLARPRVLRAMEQKHKTWAIRAGVGGAVCALLTVWMVPNTTPTAKPSVIAGMSGTAEAQKPTYSAVPDSAIPSWAASLQQMPGAAPSVTPRPMQVADAATMPDAGSMDAPPAMGTAPLPDQAGPADDAPPPPAVAEAEPPPSALSAPAPQDGYQARRAEWQAQMDATMRGQRGPS
ncbi:hypothetical protein DMC47_41355 [Nostoc sp. 3335mG]|nr:hypothetical protein DMC47_41355 [Nostoc sp. 3335mG]